jgi:ATP-dependent DNA helicase RecG
MKNAIGNAMDKENHTSEQSILEFCKTPRTRAELIEFTGKSRVYTMDKLVNPLVTAGKLKLTLPDKPKSSKQRYVTN